MSLELNLLVKMVACKDAMPNASEPCFIANVHGSQRIIEHRAYMFQNGRWMTTQFPTEERASDDITHWVSIFSVAGTAQ